MAILFSRTQMITLPLYHIVLYLFIIIIYWLKQDERVTKVTLIEMLFPCVLLGRLHYLITYNVQLLNYCLCTFCVIPGNVLKNLYNINFLGMRTLQTASDASFRLHSVVIHHKEHAKQRILRIMTRRFLAYDKNHPAYYQTLTLMLMVANLTNT